MDDDDNELNNEVRRGLVGPIESIVAVLPDRKYKQNFWVYKVTEKQETTFSGRYFEQTALDVNRFKDTGILETVSYSSVFYSDIQMNQIKNKLFNIIDSQFQELLIGCVLD